MNYLFVDFEDSFSFNILSELSLHQNIPFDEIKHIYWYEIESLEIEFFKEFELIIFGPGPGHPDEYIKGLKLEALFQIDGAKFFGICLGHQILLKHLGFKLEPSVNPLHGQSIRLELNEFWRKCLGLKISLEAQRYNSIAVVFQEGQNPDKMIVHTNEIMAFYGKRVLSYQFHPESVGSNNRKNLFHNAIKFFLEDR